MKRLTIITLSVAAAIAMTAFVPMAKANPNLSNHSSSTPSIKSATTEVTLPSDEELEIRIQEFKADMTLMDGYQRYMGNPTMDHKPELFV